MVRRPQSAARRRTRRAAVPTNFFVYIVQCNDRTYYTGFSGDVSRRLIQHNAKTGAKYTATRTPVKLVYKSRAFDSAGAAMREEHRIKQLTRKEKEHLIMSDENQNEEQQATAVATPAYCEAKTAVEVPKKKIVRMGTFRYVEDENVQPRQVAKLSTMKNRFLGWFNTYDIYVVEVPGVGWMPRAVGKSSTSGHHAGIDLAIDIMVQGRADHDNDLALVVAYVLAHNEGLPSFEVIPKGSELFFGNYGELTVQVPVGPMESYTPSDEEKNMLKKQLDLMGDDVQREMTNSVGTWHITKPGSKYRAHAELVSRTKWYKARDAHNMMETFRALGYEAVDKTKKH